MRWSSILKKEDSLQIQSDVSVLEYVPRTIQFGTPEAAIDYLREKEAGSDFVMNDVIRKTTGIEEIEKQSEEQKIEQKVLEKLAIVQQEAYHQAFDLGLEEGHKKAYQEKIAELEAQIEGFHQLTHSLNELKKQLSDQNESHMVRLAYDIASRLAFDHINENQDSIINVIRQAIETAQAEENVTVLISKEQYEIVDQIKKQSSKDLEFLKNIKLEASENITVGSCIVETNYGVIDASMEKRIEKLWNEMKQTLPKVKSPIEST